MKEMPTITHRIIDIIFYYGYFDATPQKRNTIVNVYKEIVLNSIINKIGDRNSSITYLNILYKINQSALYSVLLKIIAIELDKKYEQHITKSNDLYIVSIAGEVVLKLENSDLSLIDYRKIALFRGSKDAEFAKSICNDLVKEFSKNDCK